MKQPHMSRADYVLATARLLMALMFFTPRRQEEQSCLLHWSLNMLLVNAYFWLIWLYCEFLKCSLQVLLPGIPWSSL